MKKLFLDIETYYSTELKYDLKNISVVEYCRDPRFHLHGLAYAIDDGPIEWISHKQLQNNWIMQQKWNEFNVIGHTIKFDMFALKDKYNIQPNSYIDTKSMARAVFGKTIKGAALKELAEYYKLPAKGTMKTDGLRILTEQQEQELAEYCKHDVYLCREIYNRLYNSFPENEYYSMHQTINMFVRPKLRLDVPLLQKATEKEKIRRENIFTKIGIDKKEFASNIKFPALLKSRNFEVPTKTSSRTGKIIPALALGDTEFLELTRSENHELKTLCEARIAAKSTLLETRTNKLATIGITGSWPFDVEYSGATQTHRFSGGSGAGGNPQNFTRASDLREAVIAPNGYSLVVGDFSNIELRIVAYLSKDRGLIDAIENHRDLYCEFASAFFGKQITKDDVDARRFGKCAILGLGYGMGAEKFQKTVRLQIGMTISDDDAKKAVQLYRSRYLNVPKLWKKLDKLINIMQNQSLEEANGILPIIFNKKGITLPSGLILHYMNLRQENKEWIYDVYHKGNLEQRKLYGGKLLENISQALAGEICKLAMWRMENKVVGQVHDELLVLCKKGTEEPTKQKLKRAMIMPPLWMPEIKLEAEIGCGKNWKEAK